MAEELRAEHGDRVIRAGHGQDLADALTAHFLSNADAGDFEANDRLVAEFNAYRRDGRAGRTR